jgi:hypothetical protein
LDGAARIALRHFSTIGFEKKFTDFGGRSTLPDILTAFIRPRKHFREMIRQTGGLGIAIENNCAIEFIDDQFYKVISSKSYARAYRLYERGGEVVAEQIRQEKQIAPVESLNYRLKKKSSNSIGMGQKHE